MFWYILVFPFAWLLKITFMAIEFLAFKLPMYLIFGGFEIRYDTVFMQKYLIFCAIGAAVMIGLVLFKFFKGQKSIEDQIEFKQAAKRTGVGIVLMIGIYTIIYFLIVTVMSIYELIKVYLIGEDADLAAFILNVLSPEFIDSKAGKEQWATVAKTYIVNKDTFMNIKTGQSPLMIISLFVSFLALLYTMMGVFIRIVKTAIYEFYYILSAPVWIAKSVGDEGGETLKKWMNKTFECFLATLIILISLIMLLVIMEVISGSLTGIIKDFTQGKISSGFVKPILAIGIMAGSCFAFNEMITRIMYFFNLDAYAKGVKVPSKKGSKDKEKEKTTDKEKKTETKETKSVSADKNKNDSKVKQPKENTKMANSNKKGASGANGKGGDDTAGKLKQALLTLISPALAKMAKMAQKMKK
ncbi:Mbov_0396 family ICE element transmembrane protein [Mycoplasmopsis primatum]|uniref:Mbov_0396 family ICE element transmembrane protein n=1 Tax=Mycoplasmopsis primatum TaxID=55604 RepID=UPI0038CDBB94